MRKMPAKHQYTLLFLFPSNGKDFLNQVESNDAPAPGIVSIPFKREGLSEQNEIAAKAILKEFLFPSNGKDFLNKTRSPQRRS